MNNNGEPEAWQACPVGMVKQMVGRIRVDRRRDFLRTLVKGSAAVVLLGAGGVVAAQWMQKEQAQRNGELACSRVVELLPDYQARRLDSDLMRRVAAHLEKCPSCAAHYEAMVG